MGENAFLIQSPDQGFKMCQVLAAVDFLYFNVFSYLLVKQHWLIITLHSYASKPPQHPSSTWLPRALLPRRCRSVPTRGSVRATFLLRNRRGSASRFRTWHSELENNKKHLSTPFIHTQSLLPFSPVYTSRYSPIQTARFLTTHWSLRPTYWEPIWGMHRQTGFSYLCVKLYVPTLQCSPTTFLTFLLVYLLPVLEIAQTFLPPT